MHRYASYNPCLEDLNTTAGFVFSRLGPGDRVLDLGSGPGLLAGELKKRGFDVVAVDNDPDAIKLLQLIGVTHYQLDLEHDELDIIFQDRCFDVVVLCDILEHLQDPDNFLERLSRYCRKFQQVLVTIPNVSYGGVILNLIRDRFEYTETGILDRTHLRFFTQSSFQRLAEGIGYRIEAYHPVRLPLPTVEFPVTLADACFALDDGAIEALNPSFFTYQHCFALSCDIPFIRKPRYSPDILSVIVRTIDDRLTFLDVALFSIECQNYRNVEVVVVYQGTSADYQCQVATLLERYRSAGMEIHFIHNSTDEDERAHNLNLGMAKARGRYLAFLDDDDVIYPEHYEELIAILGKEAAAWGYSDVYQANCRKDAFGNVYAFGYEKPFARDGYSFFQHWTGNFIPIHSFVVDREKVPEDLLQFDEAFSRHEDYVFLLRLACVSRPVYNPKFTCEYRIRFDGSNSVMAGTTNEDELIRKRAIWEIAQSLMDMEKRHLPASRYLPEIFDNTLRLRFECDRLHDENRRLKMTFGCSPEATTFEKATRYHLADRLNNALKSLHVASLHRALKSLAATWIRPSLPGRRDR